MSTQLTVECDFHVGRRGRGAQKTIESGPAPSRPGEGRVPRVSRLMALAIRVEGLLRDGAVENYAEIGALGHVTRARVSQIMALLNLAPDIQEAILFLPKTLAGRDAIILHEVLPVTAIPDWRKQRRLWAEVRGRIVRAVASDVASGPATAD
jgi:hypothetical protein